MPPTALEEPRVTLPPTQCEESAYNPWSWEAPEIEIKYEEPEEEHGEIPAEFLQALNELNSGALEVDLDIALNADPPPES